MGAVFVNGGDKTYHWGGGMVDLIQGEEGLGRTTERECRGKSVAVRQWAKRLPVRLIAESCVLSPALEVRIDGVADDWYYNEGLPNMVSDPSCSARSEKSRYAQVSTVQVQIGREIHPDR